MASGQDEPINETEPTSANAMIPRPSLPRTSSLSSLFPQILRNRISRTGAIGSFRERISISPIQTIRHSLSMSTLPSPSGHSRLGPDAIQVSQRLEQVLGNGEDGDFTIDRPRPINRDGSEEFTVGSTGAMTPVTAETASGVRWNFATTGIGLMQQAGTQAFAGDQQRSNPTFIRRLVIDAHGYLSDALPLDLTAEEVRSIRSRLPPDVRRPDNHVILPPDPLAEDAPARERPSILHRGVAKMTLFICLFLSTTVPLLRTLLTALYKFDRAHQVSDRGIAIAIILSSALWRVFYDFLVKVMELDNGKVGAKVQDAATWAAEGFTGGAVEGFGQYMITEGGQNQGRREIQVKRTRPGSLRF